MNSDLNFDFWRNLKRKILCWQCCKMRLFEGFSNTMKCRKLFTSWQKNYLRNSDGSQSRKRVICWRRDCKILMSKVKSLCQIFHWMQWIVVQTRRRSNRWWRIVTFHPSFLLFIRKKKGTIVRWRLILELGFLILVNFTNVSIVHDISKTRKEKGHSGWKSPKNVSFYNIASEV